jgi:hypothetical protein
MASILDLYKGSDFAKIGKSTKDKTPISADEKNALHAQDAKLNNARGGKLNEKPYSDTIKK